MPLASTSTPLDGPGRGDSVNLSSLSIHLAQGLGPSAFNLTNPPPACPIILDLSFHLRPKSIEDTANGDSMSGLGVNYSAVSKAIYALASDPTKVWSEPWELMRAIARIPLALDDVESVAVQLEMPKALLHAMGVVYSAAYTLSSRADAHGTGAELEGSKDQAEIEDQQKKENGEAKVDQTHRRCLIKDMKTQCIIGLHSHERTEKQRMEVDVLIQDVDWEQWGHKAFADEVYGYVSSSEYYTIESLIHELGRQIFTLPILASSSSPSSSAAATFTIRKPSAIPFAVPSITIRRTGTDYAPDHGLNPSYPSAPLAGAGSESQQGQRVFIAVGSNIGDRVDNITRAIKMLEESGCELKACSRLYESEPMYVEDQDRFVNGAIELSTQLKPLDLLRLLKRTEKAIGRRKTYTNGPRVIDLDLVFYGKEVVKIGSKEDEEDQDGVRWLECPHAALAEREFVLRPLADIAPDFVHPSIKRTIKHLLDAIPKSDSTPALQPIIPFHTHSRPIRLSSPFPSVPHIMAIFNATPDSFSDGDASRTDTPFAIQACQALVQGPYPPTILDIGGMSTRPNSQPCTEEEEISRVVPLIRAIRASSDPKLKDIPISIDTYRPNVARAAVEAGASCINDVRGGREPGMLEVMAKLDVPVILMHSRGDSSSMITAEAQDYTEYASHLQTVPDTSRPEGYRVIEETGSVVEGVITELEEAVQSALDAGVKRWNIIIDPGLGFAKSQADNIHLLKHISKLVDPTWGRLTGYPLLVGGSRKGFVGRVIGQEVASARSFGDAALNAWCVNSGVVDILRVHQCREAGETVKMAVAIRDSQAE